MTSETWQKRMLLASAAPIQQETSPGGTFESSPVRSAGSRFLKTDASRSGRSILMAQTSASICYLLFAICHALRPLFAFDKVADISVGEDQLGEFA